MSIAIILRKQAQVNRFRDLMIHVIKSKCGDSALLCSGFFQELKGTNPNGYRASTELQFAQEVAQSNVHLITVGIHNNSWMSSYLNFVRAFRSQGANITAYYKNGLHWHAKVFILSKGESSFFGIIGSSNITKNAFSCAPAFNNECDVILWDNTNQKIHNLVETFFRENTFEANEIIRGLYDERNNDLTVQERLVNLKKEILEIGLQEID